MSAVDLLETSGTANGREATMLILAACNVAGGKSAVHVQGVQATLHHIVWGVVSLACQTHMASAVCACSCECYGDI